jgi:hypothetical protein
MLVILTHVSLSVKILLDIITIIGFAGKAYRLQKVKGEATSLVCSSAYFFHKSTRDSFSNCCRVAGEVEEVAIASSIAPD